MVQGANRDEKESMKMAKQEQEAKNRTKQGAWANVLKGTPSWPVQCSIHRSLFAYGL